MKEEKTQGIDTEKTTKDRTNTNKKPIDTELLDLRVDTELLDLRVDTELLDLRAGIPKQKSQLSKFHLQVWI